VVEQLLTLRARRTVVLTEFLNQEVADGIPKCGDVARGSRQPVQYVECAQPRLLPIDLGFSEAQSDWPLAVPVAHPRLGR
jgi:hypothetical protein